jgi:hypothetical protein
VKLGAVLIASESLRRWEMVNFGMAEKYPVRRFRPVRIVDCNYGTGRSELRIAARASESSCLFEPRLHRSPVFYYLIASAELSASRGSSCSDPLYIQPIAVGSAILGIVTIAKIRRDHFAARAGRGASLLREFFGAGSRESQP